MTTPRTYSCHAVFDTFQGEGARAGQRSVFVRLAGCNLWDGVEEHRDRGRGACAAWCDTDFRLGKSFTGQEILDMLNRAWSGPGERWTVLTGGEPLLQVDQALVDLLHGAEWRVAVETNGTRPAPAGVDWLTVSPKLPADGAAVELEVRRADELKVVLPGHPDPERDWRDEDLLRIADRLRPSALYVQPMDPHALRPKRLGRGGVLMDATRERLRAAADRCMLFVRAHPEWRLGIQMQKVVGIP